MVSWKHCVPWLFFFGGCGVVCGPVPRYPVQTASESDAEQTEQAEQQEKSAAKEAPLSDQTRRTWIDVEAVLDDLTHPHRNQPIADDEQLRPLSDFFVGFPAVDDQRRVAVMRAYEVDDPSVPRGQLWSLAVEFYRVKKSGAERVGGAAPITPPSCCYALVKRAVLVTRDNSKTLQLAETRRKIEEINRELEGFSALPKAAPPAYPWGLSPKRVDPTEPDPHALAPDIAWTEEAREQCLPFLGKRIRWHISFDHMTAVAIHEGGVNDFCGTYWDPALRVYSIVPVGY